MMVRLPTAGHGNVANCILHNRSGDERDAVQGINLPRVKSHSHAAPAAGFQILCGKLSSRDRRPRLLEIRPHYSA